MSNFEELGFKVGPSFLGLKVFVSNIDRKWRFSALQLRSLGLELKMDVYSQKKRGPTLKPSSLKLGTCKGQNSFTLAYQSPFQNQHFRMCVAST